MTIQRDIHEHAAKHTILRPPLDPSQLPSSLMPVGQMVSLLFFPLLFPPRLSFYSHLTIAVYANAVHKSCPSSTPTPSSTNTPSYASSSSKSSTTSPSSSTRLFHLLFHSSSTSSSTLPLQLLLPPPPSSSLLLPPAPSSSLLLLPPPSPI